MRLYLLRHAKAEPGTAGQDDFDRPLAAAGVAQMAGIVSVMGANGYAPAEILCSSARRTRDTLAGLLPALRSETVVALRRDVYEAGTERLLAIIRQVAGNADLMLIGHNPGVSDLAQLLAAEGDTEALAAMAHAFPPAGLAVIDVPAGAWSAIAPRSGRLAAFHRAG